MDALQAELLAAFEAELADHLAAIRAALAEADAGRAVDLRDVSRRAHSLKGAARAVEQPETEALAHEAEALLLAVEAGERALDGAAIAELRGLVDRLQDSAAEETDAPPDAHATEGRVRVGGRHVERLARSLHDLSHLVGATTALEGLEALRADLATLEALAGRGQAGELARGLARCVAATDRLRREEARRQGELERMAVALEADAERLLLVPIETLFEGYERMVRELAAAQEKRATLRVGAFAGEADRRVLQTLREPVLHLLRNAVSHGIESPTERRRAGKPEEGTVAIAATLERGRLTLSVGDDGRGLDHRGIERRARDAGLLAPDAPRPGRAALEGMIFAQGFSTAETVDEVSGRGIGLSVVAETARRLHGRVSVGAGAAGGTEFRLSVPAAQTRQTLLLVEAGGELFGLPASAVERLLRVAPAEIVPSEGRELLPIDGEAVPVAALAGLVGAEASANGGERHPAVLLRAGGERLVLAVDGLCEVRSLVVGDPTAIAADAPLVFGAALIDARVALVLDPEALAAAASGRRGGIALAREAAAPAERKTVLVVDDSITTRTLEKSILEAQGYRVLVDVDGLAALERLRSGMEPIALVVADVEMPRMDGFALLTAIRNDPALKSLPVVMMTSRNSPDDIERGLTLGANAYVTKQEFDQGTLISVVQQLI